LGSTATREADMGMSLLHEDWCLVFWLIGVRPMGSVPSRLGEGRVCRRQRRVSTSGASPLRRIRWTAALVGRRGRPR
jgi:hypothetical protein